MGFFDWFKKRKPQPQEVVKPQQPEEPQEVMHTQFSEEIPQVMEVFTHDKAEWQWDSAFAVYCQQHGTDEDWEPTEEEEDIIWSYAGLHIEFFLTWAIKKGLLSDFHMEEDADEVAAVVNEEMTGHSFFVDLCDCKLTREDVAEQIYGFMDAYYNKAYLDVFSNWLENVRHKPVLGTAFAWADYHAFEPVLDAAYRRYLEQNSQ